MQCGQTFVVPAAVTPVLVTSQSSGGRACAGQILQPMTLPCGQPPSPAVQQEPNERLAMPLPLQLMSVAKVSEFPSERHHWNTNEEVAAILVAFSQHANWQLNDVQLRPPSGRMLLYCRKRVRYRRDGYCWKKRRDGKTTREDHMKLKVQGLVCIYGCYVHSAILHTFHRRCYWLLQNPNIVLVHYLNVPLNEENKLSIPTLSLCGNKEWTSEELIGQLQPMFRSLQKSDPSSITEQLIDETIRSIVSKLMISQQRAASGTGAAGGGGRTHHDCTCANAPHCNHAGSRIISPKTDPTEKVVATQPVVLNMPARNVIILSQTPSKPAVTIVTSSAPINAPATPINAPAAPVSGGQFVAVAPNRRKPDTTTASRTIIKADVAAQIALNRANIILAPVATTGQTTIGQAMDTTPTPSIDIVKSPPFLPTLTGDLSLDVVTPGDADDALKHVDLDYHDLISPTSSELNLDAFDFLNFPDFIDDAELSQPEHHVAVQSTVEAVPSSSLQCQKNDVVLTTTQSGDVHTCDVLVGVGAVVADLKCALITITDFSPEWSYPEGGSKVLVTGPWYSPTSTYTVMFDGVSLPASLVQSGVLRCFAPAHTPNLVSLEVACDGCVVSKSVVFEYKSRETTVATTPKLHGWFSLQEDELKVAIMDKLEELKKRLAPSSPDLHTPLQSLPGHQPTSDTTEPHTGISAFESHLVDYCRRLCGRAWCHSDQLTHLGGGCGQRRLTLLHLVSALGCARLIAVLIEWRSSNSSPALEYDVDAFSLDENSCSPLMWACALGHTAAAATLYRWQSSAVTLHTCHGASPVTVACQHGHTALAHWLESLELIHSNAPEWQEEKPLDADHRGSYHCERVEVDSIDTSRTHDSWPAAAVDVGLTIDIPPPPPYPYPSPNSQRGASLPTDDPNNSQQQQQRRQMKRFSVDALSDNGYSDGNRWQHDPMISVRDRDVNSPVMFMHHTSASGAGGADDGDIVDAHCRGIAMETDGPHSPCDHSDDTGITSQMATLADEIIAGMPMRIKLRPASPDGDTSSTNTATETISAIAAARDRSSSYGSFSSCSSCPTPPGGMHLRGTADDSGISTPLEGIMYEEYRYSELGSPESSLSPAESSMCLPPSPYSAFRLADSASPPPTAAEFTEYFNAPSTYMQKDFSQLMLSDDEQRKLYSAAQLIQTYYRAYRRDKHHQQQVPVQLIPVPDTAVPGTVECQQLLQRERELEAAVLIQSYYRRYKQYVYYKKMTQAAVLIQSQFRGYSAQKRFRMSRDAATLIQSSYRAYRQHEGFKRRRSAAVIIQQRFRSHYQHNRSKQTDGVSKCRKRLQQQTEQGSEASVTSTEVPTHSTTDTNSPVDSDMKESPR